MDNKYVLLLGLVIISGLGILMILPQTTFTGAVPHEDKDNSPVNYGHTHDYHSLINSPEFTDTDTWCGNGHPGDCHLRYTDAEAVAAVEPYHTKVTAGDGIHVEQTGSEPDIYRVSATGGGGEVCPPDMLDMESYTGLGYCIDPDVIELPDGSKRLTWEQAVEYCYLEEGMRLCTETETALACAHHPAFEKYPAGQWTASGLLVDLDPCYRVILIPDSTQLTRCCVDK